MVPKTQHKTLAKVVQDAPFLAAVKLAGSRRLPNATVKRMVEDIVKAPSEQDALRHGALEASRTRPAVPTVTRW